MRTFYADGNPPVSSVKFSPNGMFVLTGTLDDRLRLWNINNPSSLNGGCSKTYTGHRNTKFCSHAAFLSVDPTDPRIVSGSEDGRVRIYGVNDKGTRQVLGGGEEPVIAVDASGVEDAILTGGMEKGSRGRFWVPRGGEDMYKESWG